jgi:ribose 5-phosphate isomerase B
MFGEKEKQIVYIGSDHAGFQIKEALKDYIVEQGYEVTDLGCFDETSCDYPDIAREVSEKVIERKDSFGVLICGTGIGMSISANKLKGVRAALCKTEEDAEMARRHNNANVLTVGARTTDLELIKKIVLKFLKTDFESGEERHVRRVEKMGSLEKL